MNWFAATYFQDQTLSTYSLLLLSYAKDWLAAKNICDDKSLTKIAKNIMHMYSMHKRQ